MNLSLLKNKNFSLLILGGIISSIGNKMLSISLSLYVLKETGSAAKFASILAVSLIPTILLWPISGVISDWFNKKKILIISDIFSGVIVLFFALKFLTIGSLSINSIYILVILLSIISTIYTPTTMSVIPYIIDKDNLIDANGINSILQNMSSILAPIIGTALFSFYGIFFILFLDSISFLLASIGEMFINIPSNPLKNTINFNSFFTDFKDGIIFIKSKKLLLTILLLGLAVNLVYSPIISIGFNYISKITLNISDYQIGILNSIITISTFFAPFLCKLISPKLKLGKILFLDIIFQSFLFLLLAISSSTLYINLFSSKLVPYISLIVIGFFLNLICCTGNLALTTLIQKETPLSYIGRVQSTLSSLLIASTPIGQIIFGFLFDTFITPICILLASIILFITILLLKNPLLNNNN